MYDESVSHTYVIKRKKSICYEFAIYISVQSITSTEPSRTLLLQSSKKLPMWVDPIFMYRIEICTWEVGIVHRVCASCITIVNDDRCLLIHTRNIRSSGRINNERVTNWLADCFKILLPPDYYFQLRKRPNSFIFSTLFVFARNSIAGSIFIYQ